MSGTQYDARNPLVLQITDDMAAAAVDLDPVGAVGDVIAHRFFQVQRVAVLIEVGDFQPGAGFNPAAGWCYLTQQQLDQG